MKKAVFVIPGLLAGVIVYAVFDSCNILLNYKL